MGLPPLHSRIVDGDVWPFFGLERETETGYSGIKVKHKAPSPAPSVSGTIRRNVTTVPAEARPSAGFVLTPDEIALLADPNWISEDEADVIIGNRRERTETPIPLEKALAKLGYPLDRKPPTKR